MGKINVDLQFTANTQQAKAQLDQLKNSLNQLGNMTNLNLNGKQLTDDLVEASNAAIKLKTQLDAATNVNTGKLSLGKLNQELKASGLSLADYRQKLSSLGPEGQKAFVQLTDSIISADKAISTGSKLLTNFAQTMANVAKYQLSTAVYRGFTTAISTAYNYAQDLNASLNKIRIVTHQSVEQMDRFADRANKAAKALSTTTTAYTDAALIFYQQGLNDKQVEERTNAVIKMANVTGDNVKEVSNQLTAIWNNFAKGGKQLEYYADVITALGAATASSTAEISEGLEKFAAIAETVGLSYEYATTALATVTAETRQSADIVGTAFKTLFARIQDLELGKTLEDGTTLGKYAQALETIGVNIKTSTGEVKDMNTILDEMGAKWKQIDDATKIATAQAVAGTRQYAQLMALMENWDTFQTNLITAQNSEGELNRQAEIYAESWEGAKKRVQAAAEDIYGALLDDKFFINLTNGFGKFLAIINNVIDGMGGLKGIIPLITGLLLQFAGPQIYNGLRNISLELTNMLPKFSSLKTNVASAFSGFGAAKGTGFKGYLKAIGSGFNSIVNTETYGEARAEGLRKDAIAEKQKIYDNDQTLVGDMGRFGIDQTVTMQTKLAAINKNLTEEQRQQLTFMIDRQKILAQELIDDAKKIEQQKEENKLLEYAAEQEAKRNNAKIAAQQQDRSDRQINFNTDVKNLSRVSNALNNYEATGGVDQGLTPHHKMAVAEVANLDITKRGLNVIGWSSDSIAKLDTAINAPAGYGTQEREEQIALIKQFKESLAGKLGQFIEKYVNNLSNEIATAVDETSGYDGEGVAYVDAIKEGRLDTYNTQWAGDLVNNKYDQPVISEEEQAFNTSMQSYDQLGSFASINPESINAIREALQLYEEELQKVGINTNDLIDDNMSLEEATNKFIEAQQKCTNAMKVQRPEIEKMGKALDKETKATLDNIDGKVKLAQKENSLANKQKNSNKIVDSYNKYVDKEIKLNKTVGQSTMDVVRGLTQVASGINMIKSLGNVWSDENISIGEKFLTTITSLGMAIPMLMTGLKGLWDGFNGLLFSILGLNSALLTNEAIQAAGVAITAAETKEQKQKIITDLLESKAITGKIPVKIAEAAARGNNIALMIMEKILAGELYILVLILIAAVVALIAVMAGLVAIVKAVNAAYNADKTAMETANALLDEQRQRLEDATKAWEELKTAIADYHDQQKALNKLVEGTTEYNEALQAANTNVLNLIDKYPDLAKEVTNLNGRLIISDKGLADLEQKGLDDVSSANAAFMSAKVASNNATAKFAQTSFLRNELDLDKSFWEQTLNVIPVANAIGELINSSTDFTNGHAAEGWRDLAASIIKAQAATFNPMAGTGASITENVAEKFLESNVTDAIQQLQDAYQTQGNAIFNNFTETIKEAAKGNFLVVQKLTEHQDTLKDLIISNGKLNETNKLLTQQQIIAANAKNSAFANSKYQDFIGATGISSDKRTAVAQEVEDSFKGSNKDFWKMYLEDVLQDEFVEYRANTTVGKKYLITDQGGKGATIWKLDEYGDKSEMIGEKNSHSETAAKEAIIAARSVKLTDDEIKKNEDKAKDIIKMFNSIGLDAENDKYVREVGTQLMNEDSKVAVNLLNLTRAQVEQIKTYAENNNIPKKLRIAIDAYESAIRASIKQANEDWDVTETYANAQNAAQTVADIDNQTFNEYTKSLDEYGDLAEEVATRTITLNTGLQHLSDGYLENAQDLNKASTATYKYYAALSKMITLLQQAGFGTSTEDSLLKAVEIGGFTSLTNLFEELVQGNTTAITAIRRANLANNIQDLNYLTSDETEKLTNFLDADLTRGQLSQTTLEYINTLIRNNSAKSNDIKTLVERAGFIAGEENINSDDKTYKTIAGFTYDLNTNLIDIQALEKALDKEYDHYYSINQKIQETEKSLNRLSKAKDQAYGINKLRLMEQEEGILKEQIEDQKELINIANTQAQIQKDKMLKTIGSNINVRFTPNGQIANYEEIMEAVGPLRQEEVADAINKYVEELNHRFDAEDKIRNLNNNILSNHYEKLSYELELKTTLNENDKKTIDYFLSKVEDDIYKVAEAGVYLEKQQKNITEALAIQKGAYDKVTAAYKNGQISEADYVDSLQNEYDAILDNLEALNDYDEKMKTYYSDTLQNGIDLINTYIGYMDKQVELLNHYQSLLKVSGGEFDFNKQLILQNALANEAQRKTNELSEEVKVLEAQRDRAAKELAAADSEESRKRWQDEYNRIQDMLTDIKNQELEAAEEEIEALNEIFKTTMEETFRDIELATTEGMGFNELEKSLANIKSLADIWLDDTNKTYETNKMLRDINKAIENTDNKAAKDRYNAFANDIKALQNKKDLTKGELELAQSRYKVLQAQIALEEAQNAKSIVRLRRDNEGNFGYVYTADENKIANAEQKAADAENENYNKRVQMSRDNSEKILKINQDHLDRVKDLWNKYREGEIPDEETFQRLLAEEDETFALAKEGYQRNLILALGNPDDPASIYGTRAENEKRTLDIVQQCNEKEDKAIKEHQNNIQDSFDKTNARVQELTDKFIGQNGENLEQATKDVDTANEELVKQLGDENSGVIGAVKNAASAAGDLTTAWNNQLSAVMGLRDYYEKELIPTIQDAIEKQRILNNLDTEEESTPPTTPQFYTYNSATGGYQAQGTMGKYIDSTTTYKSSDIQEPTGLDNALQEQAFQIVQGYINQHYIQRHGSVPWEGYLKDENVLSAYNHLNASYRQKLKNSEITQSDLIRQKQEKKLNAENIKYDYNPSSNEIPPIMAYGNDVYSDNGAMIAGSYMNFSKGTWTIRAVTKDGRGQLYYWLTNPFGIELGAFKENDLYSIGFNPSFDTGGYTGQWGPSGKLAVLHQKEIVLNADDTRNFLQAVDILRSIVSVIDLGTMQAMAGTIVSSSINSANNSLNQNVTIHAEFPNAVNHTEIEQAFDNLVNKASQYANRQ